MNKKQYLENLLTKLREDLSNLSATARALDEFHSDEPITLPDPTIAAINDARSFINGFSKNQYCYLLRDFYIPAMLAIKESEPDLNYCAICMKEIDAKEKTCSSECWNQDWEDKENQAIDAEIKSIENGH